MEEMQVDLDRIIQYEHARRTAEAIYETNPQDADNLTQWGGILLELSQFQDGPGSKKMVKDAIDKLEEALVVNPEKHDALWCLGNAYTANAFLIPNIDEAKGSFDQAAMSYEQACELEPQNQLYKKSFEVSSKAPELHEQIHKQGFDRQAMGPIPSSTSTKQQSSKTNNNDLKYDICGWIILVFGIVTWVGFAKSNMPPPPPPR